LRRPGIHPFARRLITPPSSCNLSSSSSALYFAHMSAIGDALGRAVCLSGADLAQSGAELIVRDRRQPVFSYSESASLDARPLVALEAWPMGCTNSSTGGRNALPPCRQGVSGMSRHHDCRAKDNPGLGSGIAAERAIEFELRCGVSWRLTIGKSGVPPGVVCLPSGRSRGLRMPVMMECRAAARSRTPIRARLACGAG